MQNVKPEDGSTRGINRHRYSLEEADKALEQPVVEALLRLCKFRNTHPAFNGQASGWACCCVLCHCARSRELHMLLCSSGLHTFLQGMSRVNAQSSLHHPAC